MAEQSDAATDGLRAAVRELQTAYGGSAANLTMSQFSSNVESFLKEGWPVAVITGLAQFYRDLVSVIRHATQSGSMEILPFIDCVSSLDLEVWKNSPS